MQLDVEPEEPYEIPPRKISVKNPNKKLCEYQLDDPRFVGPNQYVVGEMIEERAKQKIYDSPPSFILREIPVEMFTDTLKNEIRITQSLSHPNILKIFDCFQENGYMYILKQKCDGRIEVDPQNAQALEDMIKQILTAMYYLQSCKIFHRNLKRGTIYTNDGVCKVKGLGYAVIMDDENEYLKGDPHESNNNFQYRCPEMLKGESYGLKSDIWSLGVILYELIYGKKPWEADTIQEYLKVVQTEQLKIPYDCKFSPIIKQMLEYREIDRCEWQILYQSVGIYIQEGDLTEKLSMMISLTNLGKHETALEILEEEMSQLGEFPDDQFDGSDTINPWFFFAVGLLMIL